MPNPPKDLALPATLEGVSDALARAQGENLVDLYDAWRSLIIAQAGAAADRAREADRLNVKAQTVLKSVESARELSAQVVTPGSTDLTRADPLAEFVAGAQMELDEARAALAHRREEEEAFFAAQIEQIKRRIKHRADSLLAHHKPWVQAQVQPVGKDRSIVHLTRPEAQDLVLLAYLVSGRLFTRYDAFLDDSVDELSLEPARFYAEEGNARVRFDSLEEEEAFLDEPERLFWPVKAMIPLRVPGHDFPRFRLINRGPVMEAQAREKDGAWEHLMPRTSAELLTGLFIKLKIDGRIELLLGVG
jgi:hypothetical protein